MNIEILQKCVDEIVKPEPNVSYVRGMLETIISMNKDNTIQKDPTYINNNQPTTYPKYIISNQSMISDEEIPEAFRVGPVSRAD